MTHCCVVTVRALGLLTASYRDGRRNKSSPACQRQIRHFLGKGLWGSLARTGLTDWGLTALSAQTGYIVPYVAVKK